MEDSESANTTKSGEDEDHLHETKQSISAMPAWLPAVTVATAMIIFLTASFYIRHRKVIKKRKLLMDYFYIIFQYGGMRRKRMVAALCNTNAITLRELGRSFMISFDSFGNTENSCPFFADGTAFTTSESPSMAKKNSFKNKGLAASKRIRAPFRRLGTLVTEGSNPAAFHDILMKFKTRRTPRPTPLPSPVHHIEGSSMCTIHGDDYDFEKCMDNLREISPRFNERRNAYVVSCHSACSSFGDVTAETRRHSLGDGLSSHNRSFHEQKQCGIPEPWRQPYVGKSQCGSPRRPPNQDVLQLSGESTSSNSGNGYRNISHTRSVSSLKRPSSPYRSNEPAILIHRASEDAECPEGMEGLYSSYVDGVVFLKPMCKREGSPVRFSLEEESSPQARKARRASLSKVTYVPGGNMNEYYNCLASPKRIERRTSQAACQTSGSLGSKNESSKSNSSSGGRWHWKKSPRKPPPRTNPDVPTSRKSRLSLGEIGVSDFNKRIVDYPSGSLTSMHETDRESGDGRSSRTSAHGSQELLQQQIELLQQQKECRAKRRTAWTRFKNVFSGSRGSSPDSHQVQLKTTKSSLQSDPRPKRKSRRVDGRWTRFINAIIRFRSLPETKRTSQSTEGCKGMSTDGTKLGRRLYLSSDHLERIHGHASRGTEQILQLWSSPARHNKKKNAKNGSIRDNSSNTDSFIRHWPQSEDSQEHHDSSVSRQPSKTQSFPEELLRGCQTYSLYKADYEDSHGSKQDGAECRSINLEPESRRHSVLQSASSSPILNACRGHTTFSGLPAHEPRLRDPSYHWTIRSCTPRISQGNWTRDNAMMNFGKATVSKCRSLNALQNKSFSPETKRYGSDIFPVCSQYSRNSVLVRGEPIHMDFESSGQIRPCKRPALSHDGKNSLASLATAKRRSSMPDSREFNATAYCSDSENVAVDRMKLNSTVTSSQPNLSHAPLDPPHHLSLSIPETQDCPPSPHPRTSSQQSYLTLSSICPETIGASCDSIYYDAMSALSCSPLHSERAVEALPPQSTFRSCSPYVDVLMKTSDMAHSTLQIDRKPSTGPLEIRVTVPRHETTRGDPLMSGVSMPSAGKTLTPALDTNISTVSGPIMEGFAGTGSPFASESAALRYTSENLVLPQKIQLTNTICRVNNSYSDRREFNSAGEATINCAKIITSNMFETKGSTCSESGANSHCNRRDSCQTKNTSYFSSEEMTGSNISETKQSKPSEVRTIISEDKSKSTTRVEGASLSTKMSVLSGPIVQATFDLKSSRRSESRQFSTPGTRSLMQSNIQSQYPNKRVMETPSNNEIQGPAPVSHHNAAVRIHLNTTLHKTKSDSAKSRPLSPAGSRNISPSPSSRSPSLSDCNRSTSSPEPPSRRGSDCNDGLMQRAASSAEDLPSRSVTDFSSFRNMTRLPRFALKAGPSAVSSSVDQPMLNSGTVEGTTGEFNAIPASVPTHARMSRFETLI